MLTGKTILLGVTGGIACYKAAELTRILVKAGARVDVVMTKAATEFVTPLTFQTLSGGPAHLDLFNLIEESQIGHISLAKRADLVVVAPATANCIGKIAGGIADDLLTTVVTATEARVLFCPAMNDRMWANPIVRENVAKLIRHGYLFLEPEVGELACKTEGQGRLPEPEKIFETIMSLLAPKTLEGKKILITAGPTQEPIDSVRFLSNRSSGKMGFALARAARDAGAHVILVTGPTILKDPPRVRTVRVRTALEMQKEMKKYFSKADALIMSAAVADFRPARARNGKTPKSEMSAKIELVENPDLVGEAAFKKGKRIVVGFAAQADSDPVRKAVEKLKKKNLDFIVLNDVSDAGIGFESDENEVLIIRRDGAEHRVPRASKDAVACEILDFVFGKK